MIEAISEYIGANIEDCKFHSGESTASYKRQIQVTKAMLRCSQALQFVQI